MNYTEIWQTLQQGFFPILVVIMISNITFLIFCAAMSRMTIKTSLPFIFAFGIMGGLIGHAIGASRIPVVGIVLPAVLTLISGLLIYIFGKDTLKLWRLVVPYCIMVLCFNAWIGLFIGAQMRGKTEAFERDWQEWVKGEDMHREIEKAKALKETEKPDGN